MHRPANQPPHPQQGIFDTLAETLARNVERLEPSFRPPTHRDAHPKHHGCVKGTLTVEANLKEPLQRGICAQPGKSFEVWIRFSNAFKRRHDLTWDARGMAIKLLNVGQPNLSPPDPHDPAAQSTQDFLLVSHPAFFARTAADFVDFPAAVSGAGSFMTLVTGLFPYFFSGPPWKWRLRGLMGLLGSFKWIDDPLGIGYFSQVPFSFGEQHVKFGVRPQQPSKNLRDRRFLFLVVRYVTVSMLTFGRVKFSRWENMLHASLLKHLREREARFDFMVQIRRDPMPIDDAVMVWDEEISPFIKVATITIDRLPEDFDVAEMMQLGEHLSFTPWHALREHEPLGSINAARRHVYQRISDLRHGLNKRRRREPLAGETAADYLRSIEEQT